MNQTEAETMSVPGNPGKPINIKPARKEVDVPIVVNDARFIPVYAHDDDSGADLRAAINAPIVIYPREVKRIPTGIRVDIPTGLELQVRPRSGLSSKGVVVANSPGTVDAGYRGEVGVLLANIGDKPAAIQPNERIAQAVLAPVMKARFIPVDILDDTPRGMKGFGDTGML